MTRAAALAASVYLVIAYAGERSLFFWVGLVLVALNVAGILAQARSSRSRALPEPVRADPDATSARLSELLHDPAVAAGWATAPAYWVRVTDPDGRHDPTDDVVPAAVLARHVRVALQVAEESEWHVVVEAAAQPFLDLDATDVDDAVLGVLRAHPLVAEARHAQREVYVARLHREVALDRFARLAARALAAGQVRAASRLR